MRIAVVGAGMQGLVVAENLAARDQVDEVVVADPTKPARLQPNVTHVEADATRDDGIPQEVRTADAAVLAVPSGIARRALASLLHLGVPVVDVSFTPEPPLDLDAAAKEHGTACVVDCGLAPGLSHALVAAAHRELGGLDGGRILVGGLPIDPPPAFRHAVYFNPRDLVAEYLRPARLRRGGKDEAPAPLDAEVERHHDDEMGDFEAFASDGLRSLLGSFPDVPDLVELTLRRDGHLAFMRALREAGLLDEAGPPSAPEPAADATARALGARYAAARFPDFVLMHVEGRRGDRRAAWRLLDRHANGLSAMSRTTAFTAAAVATMVADGALDAPGVHPPERIGADAALMARLLDDLAGHGVRVERVA